MACIAVSETHVDYVLEGPGPETYSSLTDGFVDLVALDTEEWAQTAQTVGVSFLFPRVYSLIIGCGWDHICIGTDEIFAEYRMLLKFNYNTRSETVYKVCLGKSQLDTHLSSYKLLVTPFWIPSSFSTNSSHTLR